MPKQRLFYIDNLRIFLISLVVLHHLSITYGAPGGWYYNESHAGFPQVIPLSMFVATNQSFFMGMFFFISALFIVPSVNKKGTKKFIADRFNRLGIPTILFYFLISPFSVFIRIKWIEHQSTTFFEVLRNGWGMSFGPMWFVEALILFTAIYLLIRRLGKPIKILFPSTLKIVLLAFLIGMIQFIIRIKTPVGSTNEFTNFQWPFFIQYIVLFPLGIIAAQNNWMEKFTSKMAWRWFIAAQLLIFVVFPAITILGGAENGIESFMGGLTWQNAAYSFWEQITGFSLIIGLFGLFKKYFNFQGKFASSLSQNAYGVYVFHTPVLLAVSALFLSWQIPQILKLIALAPLVLVACFFVAGILKKIPPFNRIF